MQTKQIPVEESPTIETPEDGAITTNAIPRRAFLKLGAIGTAVAAAGTVGSQLVPDLRNRGLLSADGLFDATSIALADSLYTEAFPTSPLILNPFQDALVIPKALAPEPWIDYTNWKQPPGPGIGQQNSFGNERHQVWCNDPRVHSPDPLVYKLELTVAGHSFTTSPVLPIDSNGKPTHSYDQFGNRVDPGPRVLPASTIYGFNGTFPGPMINNEYGRPALVRFVNRLDENPMNLDRQDFGAPDASFLTHLHNAHTAPESDGNPHYSMSERPEVPRLRTGYVVRQPVPQLAGGRRRPREAELLLVPRPPHGPHRGERLQGHGRALPHLRPEDRLRRRDEPLGLQLPGVRTGDMEVNGRAYNADGSFDVKYDIPLAFFDCRLDDGVTTHQDMHDAMGEYPEANNPDTHPEWWGKTFFKHFPNHGFVGDLFTVNGTAYPMLEVEASQVSLPLPRLLGRQNLRLPVDELVPGPEGGCRPRLRRLRAPGAVPHPRRRAVHAVRRDRHRRWSPPGADHAGQLRTVAGQATRGDHRLHPVPGRHADHRGRRDLPDQRDEDDDRTDVGQVLTVLAGPRLQDPDDEVRDRQAPRGVPGRTA